jgi:hypothetical protein
MSDASSDPTIPEESPNVLLQESRRVLGEQIKIVQEQQAQATRIIRVALTVGGLILTGISILISSPLLSNQSTSHSIELSTGALLTLSLISLYVLLFFVIVFGKIFASALVVLSPESGGIAMFRNNRFASLLSIYRKYLLPPPLSGFLALGVEEEGMSLRPGLDAEEINNILENVDSEENIVESVISYNSGCIQGNEQLIEDNRRRLSEIYGIGIIAILIISLAILMGFSFIISLVPQ